ncbi:MAG: glycosyltransferase family 4 protein [Candidatus Berkelbacteria bacterium]|nr:glycosyltransferase family 4 protein [Candidatus Berkelbacteria bacterium]
MTLCLNWWKKKIDSGIQLRLSALNKKEPILKRCALLTSIPSPYMVELIEAINSTNQWSILPIYNDGYSTKGRLWKKPEMRHAYLVLSNGDNDKMKEVVAMADLVATGSLWGKGVRFLLRCQKKSGKPLVLWCERPGAERRDPISIAIRRFAIGVRFGHANAVWGIGGWAVEEYKKALPGVKQFANMPYASNLSPYLGIPRNNTGDAKEIRFLFSGSLIYRKGVDLLVSAFLRLLADGRQVSLTLMGEGELDSELRSLAANTDKIMFIGFKDWNELPAVYAGHDVLVAPSRNDGWGLIVMEGLAAGMPTIATDRMGAALDFINDDENGWLIPAGDPDALYKAMKKAVAVPLYEKGVAARSSAEHWTLDKAAKKWCELADAALKR